MEDKWKSARNKKKLDKRSDKGKKKWKHMKRDRKFKKSRVSNCKPKKKGSNWRLRNRNKN